MHRFIAFILVFSFTAHAAERGHLKGINDRNNYFDARQFVSLNEDLINCYSLGRLTKNRTLSNNTFYQIIKLRNDFSIKHRSHFNDILKNQVISKVNELRSNEESILLANTTSCTSKYSWRLE